MPHSFGCEAIDWLRDFALGVSVVILDGASDVT